MNGYKFTTIYTCVGINEKKESKLSLYMSFSKLDHPSRKKADKLYCNQWLTNLSSNEKTLQVCVKPSLETC